MKKLTRRELLIAGGTSLAAVAAGGAISLLQGSPSGSPPATFVPLISNTPTIQSTEAEMITQQGIATQTPGAGVMGDGVNAIMYSLFDDFSDNQGAGSVNLSLSTDGKSKRRAYDPDNNLSIASGNLVASGTSGTSADFRPGFWFDAFPRPSVIMATIRQNSTYRGPDYIGWFVSPEAVNAADHGSGYSARFVGTNGLYVGIYTSNTAKLADLSNGIDYSIAVVMGVVKNETWIKGGAFAAWTKMHEDTSITHTHMYPAISHYPSATPLNDVVKTIKVCRFAGYSFDKYLNSVGKGRNSISVCLFGDSKSTVRYVPKGGNTHEFFFDEVPNGKTILGVMPNRMATSGATMATRTSSIVADLAAITTGTPQYVLWNIGANDTDSMPSEATFKANAQTCIDAIHAKWDSAKIYFMRVFVKSKATECANLAQWYADLVASNSGVCFLGPDERVFLENGDNGATYMADNKHPNVAGYNLEFENWRHTLGF